MHVYFEYYTHLFYACYDVDRIDPRITEWAPMIQAINNHEFSIIMTFICWKSDCNPYFGQCWIKSSIQGQGNVILKPILSKHKKMFTTRLKCCCCCLNFVYIFFRMKKLKIELNYLWRLKNNETPPKHFKQLYNIWRIK